jgi:hypothetical protein
MTFNCQRRGPKQDLPVRISGGFRKHKLEKIGGDGDGKKMFSKTVYSVCCTGQCAVCAAPNSVQCAVCGAQNSVQCVLHRTVYSLCRTVQCTVCAAHKERSETRNICKFYFVLLYKILVLRNTIQ